MVVHCPFCGRVGTHMATVQYVVDKGNRTQWRAGYCDVHAPERLKSKDVKFDDPAAVRRLSFHLVETEEK